MRAIWQLMVRDVRRVSVNVMAGIVIFGLVIIPSLFTWFNVIASWDPFSNTSQLKVAVASTDSGFESDLIPVRINVGEQVLSALRANDQLDWVITTEDDAIDGTKSGEYYAAIVLPPSFSTDMMTFYDDGGTRSDIAYYTNEKKNALAPKITGQGAEGVSAQISEVFTQTLGDISLGLLSSVSDFLTDGQTQAALARLEARVEAISTQLRSGAATADTFTALIQSSLPLVDGATALMAASGQAFSDASGAVAGGAAAVTSLRGVLQTAAQSLADAIDATVSGYDAVGRSVDELFSVADTLTGAQVQTITTLAGGVQQQIDRYTAIRDTLQNDIRPALPAAAQDAVDVVIDRLNTAIARQQHVHDTLVQVADDLTSGNNAAQQNHQAIADAIAAAKSAVEAARTAYTGQLQPQLDALADTLSTIDADINTIGDDLGAAAGRLSGAAGSVRSTLTDAAAATTQISARLTSSADRIDALRQALATAADTGDLSDLQKIIGSDPSVVATALAQPVSVERTAVFPVAAFGVGMAPFYTVLALWVGALLMTLAIRVDVTPGAVAEHPDLTPTQSYLGRYGIFGLVGLAQSTLITLGLILFVRIEPAHPLLLILAGWVASIVFTLIVYTLVVSFGNAGKALTVLLLVMQISGSGGAYPLQLLPPWFQSVSPFLPATHAVDALRAAIAGTYGADYWVALGWLAAFIIPALLLGLLLRRPIISFIHSLTEAVESTKLI